MSNYKPFFIRQRTARHSKSPLPLREGIDYQQISSLPSNVKQPTYNQTQAQTAYLNTGDGSQELNQGKQQDQLGINTSDFVANMNKKPETSPDRNMRLKAKIDAIDSEDGNLARKARLEKTLKKRKARQKNRAAKIKKRETKALNRINKRGEK